MRRMQRRVRMHELHPIPGCRADRVVLTDPGTVEIAAHGTRTGARCPACGQLSSSPHGGCVRRPADLRLVGRAVRLAVWVRRFRCGNLACERRTFAEALPGLVAPYARRTGRLAAAQGRVAVTAGGEAGARLLDHLGMPAGPDTLLRLIRRLPMPAVANPKALGVDDWALRKGQRYGTILVDLERHRVSDLLPDRTAGRVAAWLRHRRGIRILTRDRSTEYARGMTAGAPRARQVADRWHLLVNVRQMAERWLASIHGRLRQLPAVATAVGAPTRRAGAFPRSRAETAVGGESRTRRLALYEEVRRRHAAGEALLAISRRMRLARGTVRHYAKAETFPERAAQRPKPSLLDPYLARLETQTAASSGNARALRRDLRKRGFRGAYKQVSRWLQQRRQSPPKYDRYREHRTAQPVTPPGTAAAPDLPSAKQLAWLMVKQQTTLDPEAAAILARITQDPQVAETAGLIRRFVRLFTAAARRAPRRALAAFTRWLRDAAAVGVSAIVTFAAGLRQDSQAVRAALVTPWSNGQSEGQITKVKLLKRQMYGRANFGLLRRRVLLAT
jgi:transposase